jgi:internalin A
MPAGPVSRPWRRFLRFSVRGMLVLVVLIGGWLGWMVRSARIQREAVAAINDAGGRVSYDWDWSDGQPIVGGKPWAPEWLTDLIGVDFFGHVTFVDLFSSSKATDATFTHVARLTQLETLLIGSSPRGDDELAHLKSLSKLSGLVLIGTRVTDAGLAHLKGMTNLSFLYLIGTQVTDAGMRELKQALPGVWIEH